MKTCESAKEILYDLIFNLINYIFFKCDSLNFKFISNIFYNIISFNHELSFIHTHFCVNTGCFAVEGVQDIQKYGKEEGFDFGVGLAFDCLDWTRDRLGCF